MNHILGANTPTEPIDVVCRYAYNQGTIQLLERWWAFTCNARTGGVAATSAVKALGHFFWQIPNMAIQQQVENTSPSEDTLVPGAQYTLEGVMITGLIPSGADMKIGNDIVRYTVKLHIDRYYPTSISNLIIGNTNVTSSVSN